jgi:hypothetical protein
MVPFLTALEASDDHTTFLPFIAPVNHNKVDESKRVQRIHTFMGNFCHEDKNKESQSEDMGNDACIMVAYHAKVIRSAKQDNCEASNIVLPCPSS